MAYRADDTAESDSPHDRDRVGSDGRWTRLPVSACTDQRSLPRNRHLALILAESNSNTTEDQPMWRTSSGERTLHGAEARLFAEALLSLLDEAHTDQLYDYQLGLSCFDNLTYGQKVYVLATYKYDGSLSLMSYGASGRSVNPAYFQVETVVKIVWHIFLEWHFRKNCIPTCGAHCPPFRPPKTA